MRGSVVGLVIGLGVGAGAMYLVLRPPWAHRRDTVIDAGDVASAPADAPAKPGKKKPRRPGHASQPGQPQMIDDVDESGPETPAIVLTQADRALETRGDDVLLPKQHLDMGAAGEPRALDDSEIQATINNQSRAVQACVVQGATNTDLHGTITVQIVVDGAGRVVKTRLTSPRYLLDHGLMPCAKGAAARMKFPATGAPTLVTFPINLT